MLDVIIGNAESKSSSSDESGGASVTDSQVSAAEVEINTAGSGVATTSGSDVIVRASMAGDTKPSASGAAKEEEFGTTLTILLNLPQAELRLLCSLLAREGYGVF